METIGILDPAHAETRTAGKHIAETGEPLMPLVLEQAALGEAIARALCSPPSKAYERERRIAEILAAAERRIKVLR